ncbi:MAG TPA: hypothetical protein VGN23_08295, partial [Verrucomicrobiae bacterium]
HSASLARTLPAEKANLNPYRSHPQNPESSLPASRLHACPLAQPDDSDSRYTISRHFSHGRGPSLADIQFGRFCGIWRF